MAFPRITAAIIVILLISSLALVTIGSIAYLGPQLVHGGNVQHADGTIVAISPNMNFVLKMADGQTLHFECSQRCHLEEAHMARHLREKAHTDIYYVQQAGHVLDAIDVD